MKKKITAVLSAIVLAVSVSACSGDAVAEDEMMQSNENIVSSATEVTETTEEMETTEMTDVTNVICCEL